MTSPEVIVEPDLSLDIEISEEPEVQICPPNGLPGRNGLSAYELAVTDGFVGTQAEWLASLVGATGSEVDLTAHINDPAPHPVYDDGPSLFLLYENSKV